MTPSTLLIWKAAYSEVACCSITRYYAIPNSEISEPLWDQFKLANGNVLYQLNLNETTEKAISLVGTLIASNSRQLPVTLQGTPIVPESSYWGLFAKYKIDPLKSIEDLMVTRIIICGGYH